MPPWLGVVLFLLLVAGVVLAFFVARQKGLGRFSASMATARAEGAAELRAQLGQHVQVSVDNSRRVHSPGGSNDDPALVADLLHVERARLRHIAERAVMHDAAALDPADEYYHDDATDDDDDYVAALSRAMDHDDQSRGYDSVVYPSAAVGPGPAGPARQRGQWPAPHGAFGGRVRPSDPTRALTGLTGRDDEPHGRGPGR